MVFSHGSFMMGQVLNISCAGLQLQYLATDAEPGMWQTVDIYIQHDSRLHLLGIPCELTYDIADETGGNIARGRFHLRIAGLKFGHLSEHQKKMLTFFIKECTGCNRF